jgi:SRSO17 transposase
MSELPRKHCFALAEYIGDRTPGRTQQVLERRRWDITIAMATVRDFVAEHLADDGLCVLVLDVSGDEKAGNPHGRGQAPGGRLRGQGRQRGQLRERHLPRLP